MVDFTPGPPHPGRTRGAWKNNKPYNGFRIDYAFAADALNRRVLECSFEHSLRYPKRITDHSALHVRIANRPDAWGL